MAIPIILVVVLIAALALGLNIYSGTWKNQKDSLIENNAVMMYQPFLAERNSDEKMSKAE